VTQDAEGRDQVPGARISDEERRDVIAQLSRHCADGRLTMYETEERMSAAANAMTRAELEPLLADLPRVAPRPRPTGGTVRPPHPPALRGTTLALRIHVAVFGAVMAFLVLIWLLTSPTGYFWPIWPGLGWGLAVAIHALVTKAVNGEGGARSS
jgi:hypothetical protein